MNTMTANVNELEKVDEDGFVVLASGGPMMKVLDVKHSTDGVLCVICDDSGTLRVFDSSMLRMLVAFDARKWLS